MENIKAGQQCTINGRRGKVHGAWDGSENFKPTHACHDAEGSMITSDTSYYQREDEKWKNLPSYNLAEGEEICVDEVVCRVHILAHGSDKIRFVPVGYQETEPKWRARY